MLAKIEITKPQAGVVLILFLIGTVSLLSYATPSNTITLNPAGSGSKIGSVIDQTKENEKIGPYDNNPTLENVTGGTGGEIENGNLYFIWPNPEYGGGLWIQIELVNRKDMDNKYYSFEENIAVYQADTDNVSLWTNNEHWNKLSNQNKLLIKAGRPVTFQIEKQHVDNDYPLVITLENGSYSAKENHDTYPKPLHYSSIEQADY